MPHMFFNCFNLKSIDLYLFDTKNVIDISHMFFGCRNLSSIDLSFLDTKNANNMAYIFYGCEKLTSLDLSEFDTENIIYMGYMFDQCKELQKIKVKKNFFKNFENLYDKNKEFIKKGNLLINSIEYEFNPSPYIFGGYYDIMNKELKYCIFEMGFQIYSLVNDTLYGALEGPIFSPYQSGFFLFKIIYDDEYIFKPPKFYFISKIFHPNIGEDGFVSINILQNKWSPIIKTISIIYSIQSLLDTPDTKFFLNQNAAKLYNENKNKYNEVVKNILINMQIILY